MGAIDGKHVAIIAPANSGSLFYNYKKTHSIVLMGIGNAEYELSYIDVGVNGRHSDGGIYKNCSFYKALENNQLNIPPPKALPGREVPVPYTLVGDDAFALSPNLLKPYGQRNLNASQRIFNYRLSRARRIIENIFGIMSAWFRVLRSPILLSPDKARVVTKACAVLHNFLLKRNKQFYAPPGTFDQYLNDGSVLNGNWRGDDDSSSFFRCQASSTPASTDGKQIREEFEQFFIAEGEVPWQYSQI